MRWRLRATTTLLAVACAWSAACGSGGKHGSQTIITQSAFPQGFLPMRLLGSGGSGDVTFQPDGDLFAVDGTSTVRTVSRANGTVLPFVTVGGGAKLFSIATGAGSDARLFAGDETGNIWVIAADGSSAIALAGINLGAKIMGLAFAPAGFGDLGGQLLAAGDFGIYRVTLGDTPQKDLLIPSPADKYVDLVFSGTTLFAVNRDRKRVDMVSADGVPTAFATGFIAPVGITLESAASELYIADAGDPSHHGVLTTVPVAGGALKKRASYEFDRTASGANGLAYDGFGAIAFVTSSPHAVFGADLPRLDTVTANFADSVAGPTVGYGDLEFDRLGQFILAANEPAASPVRSVLFSTPREGISPVTLDSPEGEQLFGVAVDPKDQAIYYSGTKVHKRESEGTISELPALTEPPENPPPAILGLELSPDEFGRPGKLLVASTDDGRVFEIDPANDDHFTQIPLVPASATEPLKSVSHLSDLVFASDGRGFVVDNEEATASRILVVAGNGVFYDLVHSQDAAHLGRPDGIEIDEGGNRLLVTSTTAGGEQLLGIDLDTGAITALANVDIDDGYFPTGIVYDRLGNAMVRQGDSSTSLHVVPIPVLP